MVNAVFDYFRCEFLWKYGSGAFQDANTMELFRILRLDPDKYTICSGGGGRFGFLKKVVYDEDTFIYADATERIKRDGVDDFFMLEMGGHSCSLFSKRGGKWEELFEFVLKHRTMVKRFDFAGDDIDGVIPLEKLKDKFRRMEFVSSFRSSDNSGKVGNEIYTLSKEKSPMDDDQPRVIDSQKGWSITFGSRKSGSTQLQCYDKAKERNAKGVEVLVGSWIRFEIRFTYKRADTLVKTHLLKALKEEKVGELYQELLHGILEIKNRSSSYDRSSRNGNYSIRVPIWKPYEQFLNGMGKLKIPLDESKFEDAITRRKNWMGTQWSSTLKQFFAMGFESTLSDMANTVKENIIEHGVSWQELAEIKNYMDSKGIQCNDDELVSRLQEFIDSNSTTPEYVDVSLSVGRTGKELKQDNGRVVYKKSNGEDS